MTQARLPFAIALALSGALHAAAAIAIAPQPDTLAVEGGGAATVALLGESFEDLAQGATPVAPTEAPPAPPLAAVPVATRVAALPPPMAAPPAPPLALPSSDTADLAAVPTVDPAPAAHSEASPQGSAAVSAAAVAAPAEHATAIDPASSAPEASPRPLARAAAPAPARPVEKRAEAQSTPVAAGNADRNARKGAQSGQDAAPASATAAGSGAQAAQAGNAARATYPAVVLRKIERTRKPASRARGSVVVAFRVAPSGGLASAQVVRSSGDPALERTALDHIRRAAPFPPPPAGAETDFRFEFVGRR
ncbi:energy transducer TonB family protein [Pseudotabrizicola formosa]|uniref:energy transducer TonB family protein n=1 Tax=Pseudotabrizicola formosa TaxID=2030009 RepID=UPI000CD06870|nr:energy transducer TonB [Pseudotabrizicola formosa]